MNIVCLNGRLADDPKGGESAQGVAYATFSIVLDKPMSKGEREPMYVPCCVFRQTADFVQKHFKKGDGINVSGSLNVRDWIDQSGVRRRNTEVVVNQVSFPVSGKRNFGSGREKPSRNTERETVGVANEPAPGHWDES